MPFEYREFRDDDFSDLIRLSDDEWCGVILATAKSLIKRDSKIEKCYVASCVDGIIGFIYGFAAPNGTLFPQFMYVAPKYRNKGAGKALLSKIEKESGCNTSVIYYNKDLHEHYKKLGYSTGDELETAIKELK